MSLPPSNKWRGRHCMSALLALEGLRVHFRGGRGGMCARTRTLKAVDGIDLALAAGEALALVGESGCGKTTLGRAVAGLVSSSAGTIRFRGADITSAAARGRSAASREIQTVFQDPFSSLDPRMLVSAIVVEPLTIHRIGSAAERVERARALVEQVGLPAEALNRYPHEFSRRHRQPIPIPRAPTAHPIL